MLKMEIHLELSVPSSGLGVNQVIALIEQIQEQLGPALAGCYLEGVQDRVLERVLGAKWSKEAQDEAPWSCPGCGAIQGFSRRGSYRRVLRKTSLGRVLFELRRSRVVTVVIRSRRFQKRLIWSRTRRAPPSSRPKLLR